MKKTLTTLSAGLLMAGAAHAATTALNLAAAGNYSASGTTTTTETISTAVTVSTSVTIGTTGSFDIVYTLGSTGGANSFVNSTGSQYGVGSDTDISAHYSTLEGSDAEGISFTGLTVTNFVAGDSGLTVGDITDLTFTTVSFNNVNNAQDGVNISFTSFGDAGAFNQNLSATGTPYTHDLTAQGNYSAPATSLFLENDNAFGSNRWAIEGLEVFYNIPEPSSTALVGLGFAGLLLRRKRN
ncbi:MAG: PEP-CTERM sorting domain-containing protein [Luteolibacter sp.]